MLKTYHMQIIPLKGIPVLIIFNCSPFLHSHALYSPLAYHNMNWDI